MNLRYGKRLLLLAVGTSIVLCLLWPAWGISAQDLGTQVTDEIELIGQAGGTVSTIAIQDSYAYLGVGPRLLILDVSIPSQPRVAGQTTVLSGIVSDVALNDSRAFVVIDKSTLLVVDISDPANPLEVGNYNFASDLRSLEIVNDIALITDNAGSLHVIDVENPANLREIASLNVAETNVLRMITAGDRAYISDNDRSLYIVDISDPGSPFTAGVYDSGSTITGLEVVDNVAFLTTADGQFQLVNTESAQSPQRISFYRNHSGRMLTLEAIYQNYAYVTELTVPVLRRSFDISDPSNPV